MYDEIVSLGYNCEVSFRIEDYLGKHVNAMPFSWSFVVNRNKFLDALKDTASIFSEEDFLCDDRMIMCKKYELKFHPRYSVLPRTGEYSEEQYKEALVEVKARVKHLSEKFVDLCNSNKKTLFVMKVEDKGNADNIAYIKEIGDILSNIYISGNYMLAIAMVKSAVTQDVLALQNDKIKIFPLKKFAPKKFTNILGDIRSWYKLFYCMTGEKSPKFYRRIYKRRYDWGISVIKRKLHMG